MSSKTLVDAAYDEIRRMIQNLELLPGETILISHLSEKLHMSRTPVRQAIERLRLNAEGLVETMPRKGMVVTIPDASAMQEIYEIMQGLEGSAVRLAIKRGSEEIFNKMAAAIELQNQAIEKDDRETWGRADREFHQLLINASGNLRLMELVGQFTIQLDRTRIAALVGRSLDSISIATREHTELLKAIRQRNTSTALLIHDMHRQRAIDELPTRLSLYKQMIENIRLGEQRE
ncbi:MAG: GntR family transcriptional regulator [Spirochaetes bacterium]|nr:GntR family transcriptional regulator [Spirochaetota bacterium]